MVGLGCCTILALVTATLGQDQELSKIIKDLDKLVQEKKHNEVVKDNFPKKFSSLGKFRQAVIGTAGKFGQRVSTPQPLVTKSRSGNLILDKFRAFTHQKLGRQKEAIKDATKDTTENKEVVHSEAEANVGKKVVEQLHNLVTTGEPGRESVATPTVNTVSQSYTSTDITSQEDLNQVSGTPGVSGHVVPSPDVPGHGVGVPGHGVGVPSPGVGVPNHGVGVPKPGVGVSSQGVGVPSPLGLTADTSHKRSAIHDTPEGDGLFLGVVVCVAVVCILGVLGVGYCVHHPTCPRASSPFSDSSPSFTTAQLAFSSSPEHLDKGEGALAAKQRCDGVDGSTCRQDGRTSQASRAHKFRSLQEERGHSRHSGVQRMESLIDIGQEEEEDDMIYECPGLAPHGEMEVTNPFFLSKGLDLDMEGVDVDKMTVSPCPVNINNNMRHGNIHRNIQPGQQ